MTAKDCQWFFANFISTFPGVSFLYKCGNGGVCAVYIINKSPYKLKEHDHFTIVLFCQIILFRSDEDWTAFLLLLMIGWCFLDGDAVFSFCVFTSCAGRDLIVCALVGFPFELNATIMAHAGTGWDELPEDDVFLEADEVVALALDGRVGEHLGGFLERCGRKEGIGCQCGLGDTEELDLTNGWTQSFGFEAFVFFIKIDDLNLAAGEEFAVADFFNLDLTHHLANHDFDVLVVDINTLEAVNFLYFAQQVFLNAERPFDEQEILWVDGPFCEFLPGFDALAIHNCQMGCEWNDVYMRFAVVGDDGDFGAAFVLANGDAAIHFGDDGLTFRSACFEQFFDTRKTLGDVAAGDTAGMEGTHGELGPWFTDGLCGDGPDGFTNIDNYAKGEVDYVDLNGDNVADYVYVIAPTTTSKVTSLFYFDGQQGAYTLADGTWVVKGYVDGVAGEVKFANFDALQNTLKISGQTGYPVNNTLYVVTLEDGVVKSGHIVTDGEQLKGYANYPLSSAYNTYSDITINIVEGAAGTVEKNYSDRDTFADSLYHDYSANKYYSVVTDLTKVVGTMGNPADQHYYFVSIQNNGQLNALALQAYAYDKVKSGVDVPNTATVIGVALNANKSAMVSLNANNDAKKGDVYSVTLEQLRDNGYVAVGTFSGTVGSDGATFVTIDLNGVIGAGTYKVTAGSYTSIMSFAN